MGGIPPKKYSPCYKIKGTLVAWQKRTRGFNARCNERTGNEGARGRVETRRNPTRVITLADQRPIRGQRADRLRERVGRNGQTGQSAQNRLAGLAPDVPGAGHGGLRAHGIPYLCFCHNPQKLQRGHQKPTTENTAEMDPFWRASPQGAGTDLPPQKGMAILCLAYADSNYAEMPVGGLCRQF